MDEFRIKVWKNGLEVFECKFKGKIKSSSTVALDEDSISFSVDTIHIKDKGELISLLSWVLEEIEERITEDEK